MFNFKILSKLEYKSLKDAANRAYNLERCAHWFHKTSIIKNLLFDFCRGNIDSLNVERYRDLIAKEILDKETYYQNIVRIENENKKLREALTQVRHHVVGHKGNGEILTTIDEVLEELNYGEEKIKE